MNNMEHLDKMLEEFLNEVDKVGHGTEENENIWKDIERVIKAKQQLDGMNRENWKLDSEETAKQDAAKRQKHDKLVEHTLDALKILVMAGSITIPAAVAIYFAAVNLKAENDGIPLMRNPAMKYMEKLIGQIGKMSRF